MSASFDKLAAVTASTKRLSYADGKFSTLATHLSSLSCIPLAPVSQRTMASAGLETPVNMLETYVQGGLDIIAGDILVVGSAEYEIIWVGEWYWRPAGTNTLQLVIQKAKV